MQRYQRPYNLVEVPELQEYLRDKFEHTRSGGNPDILYRQSLGIEPREDPTMATITREEESMMTLEQVLSDLS
jgi:hypothetical protein